MTRAGRDSWTEPVKGAAIVMVVLFHVIQYLGDAGVDVMLGRVKALGELFPLPAFFLVAGLAAAGHPGLPVVEVWRRRALPIAYVYLLWSALRTVVYLLVPALPYGDSDLPPLDWRTIALLPVWPSSSYWFLYALVVFIMVRRLVCRVPPAVQLAGAAVLSALFAGGWVRVDNLGWNRIAVLFVFFLVGALCGQRIKAFVRGSRPWFLLPLGAALLVLFAGLLLGLRAVPFVPLLAQLLAVTVGILAIAWLPAGRLRDGLATVGTQAFRVYLVHLFAVVLVALALRTFYPDVPRVVDVALQFVVTGVVLWLSLRFSTFSGRWRWLYVPPKALTTPRARRPRPAVTGASERPTPAARRP
ncbi:acyltransferase family protein [Kineococcus gynurae]|uniref:Acyltransferase family protein n=1 Tax=Kineococcus gynurae TaxID=452979 RepID=A0ABV5LNM9_9ACTN